MPHHSKIRNKFSFSLSPENRSKLWNWWRTWWTFIKIIITFISRKHNNIINQEAFYKIESNPVKIRNNFIKIKPIPSTPNPQTTVSDSHLIKQAQDSTELNQSASLNLASFNTSCQNRIREQEEEGVASSTRSRQIRGVSSQSPNLTEVTRFYTLFPSICNVLCSYLSDEVL